MSIPEKAQVGKWKEYTVVSVDKEPTALRVGEELYYSDAVCELIDKVNEMINDGWQPLGGLVIKERELGPTLACQAMVKD